MSVAGPSIIFLLGEIFFFWFLIYLIEKGFISCRKKQAAPKDSPSDFLSDENGGDEDVHAEARRIKSSTDGDMPVKIEEVTKNYTNVKALDKLSFGLDFGECFALLGVSGAGKTTCFKSLTGVVVPDSGVASICGNNISTNAGFEKARKLIGYCP
jgi:ABC-type glutathione transport system ATPase component